MCSSEQSWLKSKQVLSPVSLGWIRQHLAVWRITSKTVSFLIQQLHWVDQLLIDCQSFFQLRKALEDIPNISVTVVDYNGRVPFLSQLASTHNSDVFIGMHGAGLTHLLFLPDWGAIMELYNCDDRNCYKDLARLRGVKYFTWAAEKEHLIYPEDEGAHPQTGVPHKKFTNYRFDPDEFVRQVKTMVEYVRRHPKFVEERRRLRRAQRKMEEL